MKNQIQKGLLQSIQLSLFVVVLFAVLLYSFSSITIIALGVSSTPPTPPTSSTTATSNATLNEVTILNNKGVSLNKLGRFNESITYFDRTLAIDPNNVLALTEKGNALGGLGNYTQAITYYDEALAIDPKNSTARSANLFRI